MLDPRLLRAFVAIADQGSFTAAAEKLHMTQSTISQQLGRLEQAVGRELIDRAARPVRPTPAGERLLGYSRRILSLQHEAETLLTDPAGTSALRIGVPEDIVTFAMARAFAEFATQHREIRLDVTTGLSRDLSRRYREGEFDVVVVKQPHPEEGYRAAFPETLAWFESATRETTWPDPLPLVAFPPGGLYRDAMFARIEEAGRHWYVAFSGSSLQSILAAVEAGMGLSLLPISTTTGRQLRRAESFPPEPAMVVAIYSWEAHSAVSALIERMSAVLAERPSAGASG